MSNASPMLTQFNAGELSPLMSGRVDTEYYAKGCRTLRNFIPMPQGPAKRRGGTRFLGNGHQASPGPGGVPVLLIPFVRSQTESYVLELSGPWIRFWFGGALVEQSPGIPLRVFAPYEYTDLFNADGTPAIQYVQSADVMYLTHARFPQQKLSHFSSTNWTLTQPQFADGPWLPENDNDNNTMTVSGITGSITITALGGTFDPNCVGQLVRVFQNDLSQLKAWYPGQRTTGGNLAVGQLRRSGPNTYKCKSVAPGTGSNIDWVETGSDTLIATNGDQWDGPQDIVPNPATAGHNYGRGVQWTYQDSGYGVAIITQFIDGANVQATVLRQFPASLTGSLPSKRWQLGAWAPYLGYPTACCIFRERLTFGGSIYTWMSVAGDFENFADQTFGVIAQDNAITVQVLSDSVNTVKWFSPSSSLMVGTAGNEYIIAQNTTNLPFGPQNYAVNKQSSYGGRAVNGTQLGGSTFYVTRTGRFVREFQYDFSSDSFTSRDVTLPSDHITLGGVCAMQYAQNTDTIIWMVLGAPNEAGATLIGYTVNLEDKVRAWHSHPLGGDGVVKSIAVVPSTTGDYDELHLCVMRTVGGAPSCCIERLERAWREDDEAEDAFYVDCGGTYRGTPTSTITGLSYIEGYTVAVLADGQPQAQRVVTGGQITLDGEASVVQVGLPYEAILQPMRIEAGGTDGPAQGRIKRINKIVFRFLNSLGGKFGRDVFDGSPLDSLSYSDAPNPISAGTSFYTGDTPRMAFPGQYDQEGYVGYITDEPLPVTICGIMLAEVTYEGW